MNYLYNGVELPELPQFAYPYALIYRKWNSDKGGYGKYQLNVFDTKVTLTIPGYNFSPYGNYTASVYYCYSESYNPDGWGAVFTDVSGAKWGIGEDADLVWSNFDFYGNDGTLYLAASDPVPVQTINPAALMMGFQMGMAVRRMRGQVAEQPEPEQPEKTPIAYLYNGVGPLPDIYSVYTPELQETHPFAVVSSQMFGAQYWITVFSEPVVDAIGYGKSRQATCTVNSTEWGELTTETDCGEYGKMVSNIIWTNTDIFNEDGTLFLAASEPVPVYE